jgi:DNA primase large subunit
MKVDLDKKDLAKYPFLKEAQALVSSPAYALDALIRSSSGAMIAGKAVDRIIAAISGLQQFDGISLDFPEGEVLGYAFARMMVSCTDDARLVDRLCRYEAFRADFFLSNEDPGKKHYVAASLGIDPDAGEMPLVQYVELTAALRDDHWRLVNREVIRGSVLLVKGEMEELIRERIRIVLRSQLPVRVPEEICQKLKPFLDKIAAAYQEKMLEQFGDIEEDNFPPCIRALIDAVTSGANLPHSGRFALTAFLHTIGMGSTEIVEVFCRAPDFDVSRTMYQVEHISGRWGTEYTPPTCATMRTYGLCVNRDARCEKKSIHHPLSYYRSAKKGRKEKTKEHPDEK